jgi:iron-sulfur cluster assembly protein
MFSVTDTAVQELMAAARRSGAEGVPLRIAARALDDGSIEYGMGFDDERENDETADYNGLTVLLGAKSQPYLAATVLDYVEIEPGRFDFIFHPTNAAGPTSPTDDTPAQGGCGSGGCSRCAG